MTMVLPAILPQRRRVLLVEPAAIKANVFSAYAGLPLLGPLYLGTILSRAGFDVTVVNEDLLGRPLGFVDLDADYLLLSCLTPTVERGYELAALFKRTNPAGRVLMGGPHVSFLQEEALRFADHVVTGEGEGVITDLLRYGTAEPVVAGSPVENLDSLPFLDWRLLVNRGRLKVQPLMFSRGCPFSCNFCSVTSMFGRGYRTMSVERVLEEIDRAFLSKLFFYDDNFAVHRKRTHEIVDGLLKRAGRIRSWTAQVRTDIAGDQDLLAKMGKSNCARVYVGFESVNDGALEEMRKGQSAEDVRRSIVAFHKNQIRVHGMFIFGSDADDADVVRATSRFVRRHRLDSVQYMILTPFPGTALFDQMEAKNRILHRIWRFYDAMHVVIRPKNFSPYELQRMALDSYEDYYNLLRALNDGLETAASSLARLTGRAIHCFGAPSYCNARLKLMGKWILRRWVNTNSQYMQYLRLQSSRVGSTEGA